MSFNKASTYFAAIGLPFGLLAISILIWFQAAGIGDVSIPLLLVLLVSGGAILLAWPLTKSVANLAGWFAYGGRWAPIRELQRFLREWRDITDLDELCCSLLSHSTKAMRCTEAYLRNL